MYLIEIRFILLQFTVKHRWVFFLFRKKKLDLHNRPCGREIKLSLFNRRFAIIHIITKNVKAVFNCFWVKYDFFHGWFAKYQKVHLNQKIKEKAPIFPKGSSIIHVDKYLGIFDPLSVSPSWTLFHKIRLTPLDSLNFQCDLWIPQIHQKLKIESFFYIKLRYFYSKIPFIC